MILIAICDSDTAVRVMLSDFIKRYKNETAERNTKIHTEADSILGPVPTNDNSQILRRFCAN